MLKAFQKTLQVRYQLFIHMNIHEYLKLVRFLGRIMCPTGSRHLGEMKTRTNDEN